MRGAYDLLHPVRPKCQSSGSATLIVSAFVSIVQRVLVVDEHKKRRVKTVRLPVGPLEEVKGSFHATPMIGESVPRQPPGGVRSGDLSLQRTLLVLARARIWPRGAGRDDILGPEIAGGGGVGVPS